MALMMGLLIAAVSGGLYLDRRLFGRAGDEQGGSDGPSGEGPYRSGRGIVPKKFLFSLIGLIAAVAVMYFGGGINGGSVSRSGTSAGISSTSWLSMDFGTKTVWAPKGKSILIDYDVKIKRGTLMVWVKKGGPLAHLADAPIWKTTLPSSGSGKFRVPVPKQNLYRIHVSTMRAGGTYEGSYTLRWRVG